MYQFSPHPLAENITQKFLHYSFVFEWYWWDIYDLAIRFKWDSFDNDEELYNQVKENFIKGFISHWLYCVSTWEGNTETWERCNELEKYHTHFNIVNSWVSKLQKNNNIPYPIPTNHMALYGVFITHSFDLGIFLEENDNDLYYDLIT